MKAFNFILFSILIIVTACSSGNKKSENIDSLMNGINYSLPEEEIPEKDIVMRVDSTLVKKFISIEDSKLRGGEFPQNICDVELQGIDMSTKVMNGAMNFITITTPQKISRFFIGVKDVDGYLEYIPENAYEMEIDPDAVMDKTGNLPISSSNQTSDGLNTYVVPLMMSQDFSGTCDLMISAELVDGCITQPIVKHLEQIQTREGALEIKLSFNNDKDLDLHLYTPSGRHIYYQTSRNGKYNENGHQKPFGLDIDSNAGCRIDGINKENIFIPEDYLERGTYRVALCLYQNCNPSIATTWSVVTRYNGRTLSAISGSNPASGIFPAGTSNQHTINVMTFSLD